MAIKRNSKPTHPGALLAEVISASGLTKVEILKRLGISKMQMHYMVNGERPISPSIAVKLAALFGGTPDFWTARQATWETWKAKQEVDVSGIEPLSAKARKATAALMMEVNQATA